MEQESISSQSLNKELAYVLGVYLTDGSLSSNGWNGKSFQLKVIDKDFAEFTLKCIKKLIPSCSANVYLQKGRDRVWNNGKVSKCQDQYCINIGFNKFSSFFEDQTGSKHHIPVSMWNADLPIKKWFIAGLMDGDGYISLHARPNKSIQTTIGMGGVSEGWIWEFQKLLQEMGISTNKPFIETKNRNKPFVSFTINLEHFIGKGLFFKIERKQKRLNNLIQERSETKRHPSHGTKI